MFKVDSVNNPGISLYKLTLFYVFSIGTAVEIKDQTDYQYNRFVIFFCIFNFNLSIEFLFGSDRDAHFSIRLF